MLFLDSWNMELVDSFALMRGVVRCSTEHVGQCTHVIALCVGGTLINHAAYEAECDRQLRLSIRSARHNSTGSTVETWLSQTALNTRPPLPPPPMTLHHSRRHSTPEPSPRRQSSPLGSTHILDSSFHGSTHSIGLTRFHGSTHSGYGRASSCGSRGSGRSVGSVGSRG